MGPILPNRHPLRIVNLVAVPSPSMNWMPNLAWRIEVTEKAAKQIKKLGSADAKRIRDYLRDRIALLDHPRQLGKPLQGSELGSYWRYRVGDYRILSAP